LVEGTDSLKIKLPKGVSWVSASIHDFPGTGASYPTSAAIATAGTGAGAGNLADFFDVDVTTDNSYCKISRTTRDVGAAALGAAATTVATPTAKKTFTIRAVVYIDEEEAAFGDVIATASGKSTINNSSIKLGTYADYGYSIKVAAPETEIIAGRTAEEISKVNIYENVPQSLLAGRTVIAKLPDGVQWAGNFNAVNKDGGLSIAFIRSANDFSRANGVITNAPGSPKGEAELKNIEVNVAVDFTGDVVVEFSGSAGINDKITVAKAVAPLTVTADMKEVKIGAQAQAAGNIVIKETKAEAIRSGAGVQLELTAPYGVTWEKLPTVKVTEGDLTLGTITRGQQPLTGKHQLQIPIRTQSRVASTIEISNIVYTLDRTVPEGDLKIAVGGNAVDVAAIANRTTAATVVAATCVTPAPGETIGNGEFRIGSNIYYVGGVAKVMDVAPYIKGDRTYVPMRYLGEILGAEVVWDDAARTVTLTKGDTTVVFTIGSTSYTVNGEAKTADVAPEITNDRTMLPARFVAEAFGAVVGWDAATQTVLIQK
jgi:hypothetical protein